MATVSTTGRPRRAQSAALSRRKPRGTRQVRHVQRDHHRAAEALQFQHQAQVQAQVRGIHDADDQIGRLFGGVAPQHDVPGDGLIQGGRLQAVGAGQVEQAIGPAAATAQ